MKLLLNLMLCTFFITSCSNDSNKESGGISSQSFDQLITKFDGKINETYKGKLEFAALTQENFTAFSRGFLLQYYSKSDNSNRILVAKNKNLVTKSILNRFFETRSLNSKSSFKSSNVNETVYCDNGGETQLSGVLDDNGVGGLDVYYDNCLDHGVFLSGNAGVYFHDGDGNSSTLFFDNLDLSADGYHEVATGYIDYQNGQYPKSDIVYNDLINNFVYMQKDYEEDNNGRLFLDGKFYIDDLGYFEIYANRLQADIFGENYFTLGSLILTGKNDQMASIEFINGDIKLTLTHKVQESEVYYSASPQALLNSDIEDINFVSQSNFSLPPVIHFYGIEPNSVSTLDDIQVVNIQADDPENDVLTYSYNWYINNIKIENNSTSILPAGLAVYGDNLEIEVVASDGVNQVKTSRRSVYIEDSPITIILDSHFEYKAGETVNIPFSIKDPDIEGEQNEYVTLSRSPPGMSIEGKVLRWETPILDFQYKTFFIMLEIPRLNLTASTQVKVIAEGIKQPIAVSGFQFQSGYWPFEVANFDADSNNEILITNGENKIYTVDYNGEEFVQDWMYPYQVESTIKRVQSFNNLSGPAGIVVTTEHAVLIAQSREKELVEFYYTESGIIDSVMHGNDRIVLLTEEKVCLYDLSTKNVLWEFAINSGIPGLIISNFDSDEGLEVALASGHIFDLKTGENQWYYSSGFSKQGNNSSNGVGGMVAFDFNNDGIDELISIYFGNSIAMFDVKNKSLKWEDSNYGNSLSSIQLANLTDDESPKLLVGNTDVKGVKIFDIDYFGLTLIKELANSSNNSNAITVANVDDDIEKEVIWWSGNGSGNQSGSSIEIVKEPLGDTTYSDVTKMDQMKQFQILGIYEDDTLKNNFIVGNHNASNLDGGLLEVNSARNLNYFEISSGETPNLFDGAIVDYDNDGFNELFMSGSFDRSSSSSSILTVLNANNYSEIWNSGIGQQPSTGAIEVADVNNDNVADILYQLGNTIQIFSLADQALISAIPSEMLGQYLYDFSMININDDEYPDLAIKSYDGIKILKNNEGRSFSIFSESVQTCIDIVIRNDKLICLRSHLLEPLLIFDKFLNVEVAFNPQNTIVSLINVDGDNLLVTHYNRDNYPYRYYIGEVDLNTGQLFSSSPSFIGSRSNNFDAKFYKGSGGKRHWQITTNEAMLVTQ